MNTPKKEKQKPKRWADMNDKEKGDLTTRIEEAGFGSELRARKIFSDAGYSTIAYYFEDKDGAIAGKDGISFGKRREIDIIGQRKEYNRSGVGDFSYQIVCEVKSGYTWVLGDAWEAKDLNVEGTFRGTLPQWFQEQTKDIVIGTKHPKDPEGDMLKIFSALEGSALHAEHISSSIHHHKGDGPTIDSWYDAATKVVKTSVELEKEFVNGKEIIAPNFEVMIPVVVLDGDLLAPKATSATEFKLELEPKTHAQVIFSIGSAFYPRRDSYVHIVTIEGLAPFLQRIKTVESEARAASLSFYNKVKDLKK